MSLPSSEDSYLPSTRVSHESKPLSSMDQSSCTECDLYQPPGNMTFGPEDASINLKTEVSSETNSPTDLTLSCSHLSDGHSDDCDGTDIVIQSAEVNNNDLKSNFQAIPLEIADDASMIANTPSRQLLSGDNYASNEISYHHVKKLRGYKHSSFN